MKGDVTMSWQNILKNNLGLNPNKNFLEEAASELQELDIRYWNRMKDEPNYYREQVEKGKWGAEDLLDILEVSVEGFRSMHDKKRFDNFELQIRLDYYEPIKEQLEHWKRLERDNQ
tara:strand:- start:453 stop:800 length:348 start_codon:yes stop_codon:yes gene_type:complete